MKIVCFNEGQSGKDWLEWRKNGIGASDISVIMRSNKFKTELQLWEEKCGFRSEEPINYAMAHGIENEGKAREWINENQQLKLEPLCVEDITNPYFRASLDGYDEEKKTLVEIKCPVNDKILDQAREYRNIPMYWQHQIQWQIMLSEPIRAFVAIWDYRYESCITVEAFAQPTLQKEMREKAAEFWRKVQFGIQPKPSEKDYVIVDDPKLKELLQEYSDHDAVAKAADYKKKELKKEIVEFGDDGNFTAFGYYMTRCNGRKIYDMDQMKLDGIDIDHYLKKNNSIGFYRISPPK
jgi:putative phage-type endonuclease